MAQHQAAGVKLGGHVRQPSERWAHICRLLGADTGRQIRNDGVEREETRPKITDRLP
jgi:hypothetical protein